MSIPTPRVTSKPVEERVMRRDYIPAGEELTKAEQNYRFDADVRDIRPQFVPDDETVPTQPVGDPDKQLEEAGRLVKERSKREARAEASGKAQVERINRLAGLNVGETIALFESVSPHERQLWLEAERSTRRRKTVLGHFGVS